MLKQIITANDRVHDPGLCGLTIYFCRPNFSSLSPKRPISCRPNGHLGKNLSPKRLSLKRLVAQMTVHRQQPLGRNHCPLAVRNDCLLQSRLQRKTLSAPVVHDDVVCTRLLPSRRTKDAVLRRTKCVTRRLIFDGVAYLRSRPVYDYSAVTVRQPCSDTSV